MSLDVRALQALIAALHNTDYPGCGESDGTVSFMIEYDDQQLVVLLNDTQRIRLTETSPHFGGNRYWFCCAVCGRRVRKLYRGSDTRWFSCRLCLGLTYLSQRGTHQARQLLRISRVRSRLGANEAFLSPWAPAPARPRGMRATTYRRLREQLDRAERVYLGHELAALGHFRERNAKALEELDGVLK